MAAEFVSRCTPLSCRTRGDPDRIGTIYPDSSLAPWATRPGRSSGPGLRCVRTLHGGRAARAGAPAPAAGRARPSPGSWRNVWRVPERRHAPGQVASHRPGADAHRRSGLAVGQAHIVAQHDGLAQPVGKGEQPGRAAAGSLGACGALRRTDLALFTTARTSQARACPGSPGSLHASCRAANDDCTISSAAAESPRRRIVACRTRAGR